MVDRELAGRLQAAMTLRDQLVHDDPALTPARLHVQLGALVRDLEAFRQRVATWLDDQTLHETDP